MTDKTNQNTPPPIPQLLSVSGIISAISPVSSSQRLILVGEIPILVVDDSPQSQTIREGAWITAQAHWSPTIRQWQSHGRHTYHVMGLAFANREDKQENQETITESLAAESPVSQTNPQGSLNHSPSVLPNEMRQHQKLAEPAKTTGLKQSPNASMPKPLSGMSGASTAMKPTTVATRPIARPNAPHQPNAVDKQVQKTNTPSNPPPLASAANPNQPKMAPIKKAPIKPMVVRKAATKAPIPERNKIATARVATKATSNTATSQAKMFGKQNDLDINQGQLIDNNTMDQTRSMDERFSDPYWQNKTSFNPMKNAKANGSFDDEDIAF